MLSTSLIDKLRNASVALQHTYLSKQSDETLKNLDKALIELNPTSHTLVHLAVLTAKVSHATEKIYWDNVISICHAKLDLFDLETLRDYPTTLVHLCQSMDYISKLFPGQISSAIQFVLRSIPKLQPNGPSEFTTIHSVAIKMGLENLEFQLVVPLMEVDIRRINTAMLGGGDGVALYLTYFYHGGMIYAALQRFHRANLFFRAVLFLLVELPSNQSLSSSTTNTSQCLQVTTLDLSALQLAAFKKFLLVSLILEGFDLDRKMNAIWQTLDKNSVEHRLMRQMKNHAINYVNFVSTFCKKDATKLEAFLDSAATAAFDEDGNLGLVKQCLHCHRKRRVQSLTKIYTSLTLEKLTRLANFENDTETKNLLLEMIDQSELSAKIDEVSGVVQFFEEDNRGFDDEATFNKLQANIQECLNTEQELSRSTQDTVMTPMFIKKICEKELKNLLT